MAPLKACPRCRKLIPHGLPYCTACAPIAEAERKAKQERKAEYLRKKYNRQYNARRDPKYSKFYGSKEWKQLSKAKLSACGYKCEARLEGCKHIACEVHHTIPIRTPEGWEKRYDWDGLKGVCIVCHNILDGKTFKRREDPGVLDMREIIKNL